MHSGSRWVKPEGVQHRLAGVKTTEAEVHMATYLISCLRVQIIDGSLATGSTVLYCMCIYIVTSNDSIGCENYYYYYYYLLYSIV